MAVSATASAGEVMGQDRAVEVLAQIPLDEARDGIAVRIGRPRLRSQVSVLLDDFVDDYASPAVVAG